MIVGGHRLDIPDHHVMYGVILVVQIIIPLLLGKGDIQGNLNSLLYICGCYYYAISSSLSLPI